MCVCMYVYIYIYIGSREGSCQAVTLGRKKLDGSSLNSPSPNTCYLWYRVWGELPVREDWGELPVREEEHCLSRGDRRV